MTLKKTDRYREFNIFTEEVRTGSWRVELLEVTASDGGERSRTPQQGRLPGEHPSEASALLAARYCLSWGPLIARARRAVARGEPVGPCLSREGILLAQSVATWAAYREAKMIYRVEPLLAENLARTPWPDQVPTEAVQLPSRSPVLMLLVDGGRTLL
ncbi:MAG TPA: hypothetical protein VLG48_09410 [Candidatus Methylomirabilis sp.]|nr:hypothetical protein [Candidatus Methylomirabilis sp.]